MSHIHRRNKRPDDQSEMPFASEAFNLSGEITRNSEGVDIRKVPDTQTGTLEGVNTAPDFEAMQAQKARAWFA